MPEPADIFITELERIEKALHKKFNVLVETLSSLPDKELIAALSETNIYEAILAAGYGDAVSSLIKEYDTVLAGIAREAAAKGIQIEMGVAVDQLQYLQQLDVKRLLGQASDYSLRLKKELTTGLIAGESSSVIAGRLTEIPLAPHQLNVAAHDGVRVFQNTARMKAFEGQDVKWVYIGPSVGARDDCLDALAAGEVTEAERNRLAAGGSMRGGYNCRHDWRIVG